jgi:hypothetical protein
VSENPAIEPEGAADIAEMDISGSDSSTPMSAQGRHGHGGWGGYGGYGGYGGGYGGFVVPIAVDVIPVADVIPVEVVPVIPVGGYGWSAQEGQNENDAQLRKSVRARLFSLRLISLSPSVGEATDGE